MVLTQKRRESDTVAYRGAACNQKTTSWVHWILGRLNAKKNNGLNQETRKIHFWNQPTDGHEGL